MTLPIRSPSYVTPPSARTAPISRTPWQGIDDNNGRRRKRRSDPKYLPKILPRLPPAVVQLYQAVYQGSGALKHTPVQSNRHPTQTQAKCRSLHRHGPKINPFPPLGFFSWTPVKCSPNKSKTPTPYQNPNSNTRPVSSGWGASPWTFWASRSLNSERMGAPVQQRPSARR
jgi:hypothetical protein